MYNDYYLSSIDNKLDTVISNQQAIINNEASIIVNLETIGTEFTIVSLWLFLLIGCSIFYNFYHRIFNHK